MGRHPVDVLKAALQEAKTEAATLRIKTATLAEERNVAILERNEARARVRELEQQNAVQRENVDEAMRENTRLLMATKNAAETIRTLTAAARGHRNAMCIVSSTIANRRKQARAMANLEHACVDGDRMATALERPASDNAPFRQPVGGPEQDRGGAALPPAGSEARIRELEAEVQRLQQDRAQVGAFGFKPLGIR